MKNIVNLICVLFLFSLSSSTAAQFLLLDEELLLQTKQSIINKSAPSRVQEAYAALIADAELAVNGPNFSVVDKKISPPSKDFHDYLSISRYWWPDPSKSNGLPWIRKDGVTNPDTQSDHVDRPRFGKMTDAVRQLGYAYYFSGDERYAEKASTLIKYWFLLPESKMNPHLQYAQSVPGNNKSRRSGILDGRLISLYVLDAITMIQDSSHWQDSDNEQMNTWLSSYLKWLTKSKLGKSGAKQTNNHGAWYYFQVSVLSKYLNKPKILNTALKNTKTLIKNQFDQSGAQHHELERTRPFFYSAFNLQALTSIAMLNNTPKQTLWQYPKVDASILSSGIEFLIPGAQNKEWQYSNKPINGSDFAVVLARYIHAGDKNHYKPLLEDLIESGANRSGAAESIRYLLLSGLVR